MASRSLGRRCAFAVEGQEFELASPVRSFAAFKGQKNFIGEYWAAAISRSLVGYESWVERDSAMTLDFDPSVVALASQPFHLVWSDGERERGHTPDYFARLVDGTGVVVGVRPRDLVDEDTPEVFAFTARVRAGLAGRARRGPYGLARITAAQDAV
ncbi:TnsA-like heteromeric transposase endonuclease subunit [Streptomyces sp. NPDC058700]|uniref:TnsA-like heteromeric transposase endonuclease subunit n=1 Tax=Streptomyces sp. NPDC058700 TaxID=3346607 RepID=UPI003653F54E